MADPRRPFFAAGAPPALPDFGSTPVMRPAGGIPSPSIPNLPPGVMPPVQQFSVQVNPWWDKKWDAAQAWNILAQNFTVAAGQAATPANYVTNFLYQVPTVNRSVIKAALLTIQNPVATTDVRMTIFVNDAPVQGWNGIAFPPLSATAEVIPFNDINITLQQNDVVHVAFSEQSNPAASWTCSLQLLGWQITQNEIERVQGLLKY